MISWHPRFAAPWESPWSLAQKLAWLNASEVPDILSSVVGHRVSASPSSSVRTFNDTRWWEAWLDPRDPSEGAADRFWAGRALLGGEDGKRFRALAARLFSSELRLCRACIRTGYHSIVHQLDGLVRCPIHGTALTDTCPACHHSLGSYTVGRHRGFRCRHCDASFLGDDELPPPSARDTHTHEHALSPLVAWIGRTLPQLLLPWKREVMFGRWGNGAMHAVSLAAALLPLLAQIEPCPLESTYLVPPVPQLRFRPCPSEPPSNLASWYAYERAANVLSATDAWLRDAVVGEHLECYKRGARYLWCDREYAAFRPEFCRHGYAFALWRSRADDWLNWARDVACARDVRLAIDPEALKGRLVSAYYSALNGVELLCELYAQNEESLFDTVLRAGCLERRTDPWTMLEHDGSPSCYLTSCNVTFAARPSAPEPFCDHGAMRDAEWASMARAFKKIRAGRP